MADLPDGLDDMDAYADEFERLGQAAGADLRAHPPADGDRLVVRSARRRRTARGIGSAVTVAALVVGLAWVVRSDDPPAPSGVPPAQVDPGWIVYEVGGGPRQMLKLVRPDGSDARLLVPDLDGGDQSKPDWSPDGTRIVFTMATSGGESLWTVAADGSDPTLLLDCSDDCIFLDDPSWSPDGTKIVYARMTRRNDDQALGSLEQIDVDARTVDVLLTGEDADFFAGPRWSPDGRSIVLEVVHRSDSTLAADVTGVTLSVVDLATPSPTLRPLTGAQAFAVTPDWSPTGDLIVYAAPPDPTTQNHDLFTIAPIGGQPQRLTALADSGGYAVFPTFTPSGDQVIFSASTRPGDVPVLATINSNGGEPTTIGPPTISATHPRR